MRPPHGRAIVPDATGRNVLSAVMDHADHVGLIRRGVEGAGPRWLELGAGEGAFTLALADLLGPAGSITALHRGTPAPRPRRGPPRRAPRGRREPVPGGRADDGRRRLPA